jgi:hypothetical protein
LVPETLPGVDVGVFTVIVGIGVLVARTIGDVVGMAVAVRGKGVEVVLVVVAVTPLPKDSTNCGGWLPSRDENETESVLVLTSTKL